MMRSSILGASTMLNVLIQHLPLKSLFWLKNWRAFRAQIPAVVLEPGCALDKLSNEPKNIQNKQEMKELWEFH